MSTPFLTTRRYQDFQFTTTKPWARTQADMLIAATAIEHRLPLVTRNVRDFEGLGIPLLNPFSA